VIAGFAAAATATTSTAVFVYSAFKKFYRFG